MTPQQIIFKQDTCEINKTEQLSVNAFLLAWNDFIAILNKEYAIDFDNDSELLKKLFLEWMFKIENNQDTN